MKTRSVLERGSPLPLSEQAEGSGHVQSARGLAQSKTWRFNGARDLSRFNSLFTQALLSSRTPAPFAAGSGLKSALLHALALCLLMSVLCPAASGQYSLDWSTIDGGGGTSTGGVYTVTGTIGQPDAGTMSGGNFTLAGGFWGWVAAVQTPGAPWLTITLNSQLSTITVSWALSETPWQLQATTNLVTTGSLWTECSYQTNGATCYRIESPPTGNKFYRLQRP
jgi:hypothetical protein